MQTKDREENPYGRPVVTLPDAAEHHGYYAHGFETLLGSEATANQYFMARVRGLRAEGAPPFHVHTREDEIWIVNSGLFRFWLGGESLATATVHDVGPGGVVYGPRGLAHTFQSIDGAGDVTVLWNPGGIQDYFTSVGEAEAREDFDNQAQLESYGMHVLDRAPVDGG